MRGTAGCPPVIAMDDRLRRLLRAEPATGRRALITWVLRILAGVVFVAFGAAKFADHAAEVDAFRGYGLPSPETLVYAIGVLEVLGGALLIVGLATRFVAITLAGNMAGAIVTSGLLQGEVISLTLAPALLATMLFVTWTGPGSHALDVRSRH